MPHDARTVANEFVMMAEKEGDYYTNLKIIKLVYFAHAWMLGVYGEPLIQQDVEAWEYGPVIPVVYRSFKKYGRSPILSPTRAPHADFNEKAKRIIQATYKKYGILSAMKLSLLTHADGTPWDQIRSQNRRDTTIPNDLIKRYYADQIETAKAREK